ncbi:MAG: hypothetical protein GX621_10230, partial [Pirellulaceae bacterium]|nr:hypothetical protein [Pirellulaceae bacterium]
AVKLDYNADDNLGGFDRFGRVVDQVWQDYSGTPTAIDRYTYAYDRAGNRTAKTNELNHDLDETYGYDPLDRLEWWNLDGVRQKTWSLDSLGNNLAAGTYNPANEATPTVGSSGYDAAGNMTTLHSGDTATYDAWNRLVEVNIDADHDQWHEYDAAGRRIATTTRDYDMYSEGNDYHVGQQVVETIAPAEGSYQFVWSPRYIDAPILRDTLDGGVVETAERVYYLADANYNVTGLVKYDSGEDQWQTVERYTYTPYGEVTYRDDNWYVAFSSDNANTTLYTGRTLDRATGLYYYRARYYDAGLERFVSRDPIGYAGQDANLYRYTANRPTVAVDPSGKYFVCAGVGAATTVFVPVHVPSMTGIGLSGAVNAYQCVGYSPGQGWFCQPCVSVSLSLLAGAGFYGGAGIGPVFSFNVLPNAQHPSEGPSIQVGVGGAVGAPAPPPALEITVDVDISSGDTTIVIPHMGIGAGGYVSFRLSGACTACRTSGQGMNTITEKLQQCFADTANRIADAFNLLNGFAIGNGEAQTITIPGEPSDSGDMSGATLIGR